MRAPDTYSALTRPEKNSVVMQRILNRAAVAYKGGSPRASNTTTTTNSRSGGGKKANTESPGEAVSPTTSARSTTSPQATSPSSPLAGSTIAESEAGGKACQEVVNAGTMRRIATVSDTCTGYLATLQATMAQLVTSTSASTVDLYGVLQMCVARQNEVCAQRANAVCTLRREEEQDYVRRLANLSEARERLENSCAAHVFAALCAESRRRWLRVLRGRCYTHRIKGQKVNSNNSPVEVDMVDREEEEDSAGLPRPETLYRCLVDGLNDEVTRRTVKEELLRHYGGGVHLAGHGLPAHGVLSVFQPHIALFAAFPSLLPDLMKLRRDFAELHSACAGSRSSSGVVEDVFMPDTVRDAEVTLDALLRGGETVASLSALMLRGVHPSVRRLCYARALQLDIAVTAAERDGGCHSPGSLLACLVAQRGQVSPGCNDLASLSLVEKAAPQQQQQERRVVKAALQTAMQEDVDTAVGNSNRYFIVKDDVARLGAALVNMILLPDTRDEPWGGTELQRTLTQLGRPVDAFSTCYQLELMPPPRQAGAAGNASLASTAVAAASVPQRGCRLLCYPVRGSSLLVAPLCYVTGDAAEQQALAGAMAGQLWCRLLGPTPELTQCCWLFESLVACQATLAYAHVTRSVEYPMLRLAVRWMVTGFAELLEPAQVLVLYDLILAYHVREMHVRGGLSRTVGPAQSVLRNSSSGDDDTAAKGTPCALWLLPMLAAAIFVFRAPLLLRCANAAQVERVLLSGHVLRTRALLQNLLFLSP